MDADPMYPDPYFSLARWDEQHDQFAEAVDELAKLHRASPETPGVICRQAELMLESNQFERAVIYAHEAIQKDPACGVGHAVAGMLLDSMGETDMAIRELREAVRLAPKDGRAPLELAQVLGRAGKFSEAVSALKMAAAFPEYSLQVDYLLAWLLTEHGPQSRYSEAEQLLKRVLQAQPNYPAANGEYGILLARRKLWREARPYLERSLQGKKNPIVLESLAEAYRHLGNPHAADAERTARFARQFAQDLRKARHQHLLHPDDTKNNLQLAGLERIGGDSVDAMDLVKGVLEKDPDNRAAIGLLHQLYNAPTPIAIDGAAR